MKLLFHINSLGFGGAERVVSILANSLSSRGNDVIIATEWTSEREYALPASVRRVSVGLRDKEESKNRILKIILRHIRLRRLIRDTQPDLVISFCVKANFRAAVSMLGIRIPLLVSVRNDPLTDYKPHRFFTKLMERKAAGCVFQTDEAMSFFSAAFQKRSRIIYNPLTTSFLEEAEGLYLALPRKEDGTVLRQKKIVAVGRIAAQKNHRLLVEAFAELSDQYPEHVCRIYGECEDEALTCRLKDYIHAKGLQDRIFLMPPSRQIQREIADASLFVLSSDYEGLPNSLMEAMALGLPCISTDCPCGGPRMLIRHGENGLLVTPGSKDALKGSIKELLDNTKRADQLGKAAMNISSLVREDVIVAEWESYINELTGTEI